MTRFFPLLRRTAIIAAGCSLLSSPPAAAQPSTSVGEASVLVGNTLGPQALEALVGVIGHFGTPQPKAWEFLFTDPAAKGGVRALKVTGRRATPKAPDDGGYESTVPLGFFRWSDVKVDSITAFHAVDQEARAAMIGFDSVQYVLRAREGTTQPVWFLSLWDKEERTVGRLEISATTGKVERRVWLRYVNDNDVPAKVEDSLSPYASMRPMPPPPPTPVPPVAPTLPIEPSVNPGLPDVPGIVPPPPPPVAPDPGIVPPPLPGVPTPAPEPAPGYTPLPN
ncbi:MAG: hypothetical protein ACKO2G_16130 [Verrucomicrobiales bacterium]